MDREGIKDGNGKEGTGENNGKKGDVCVTLKRFHVPFILVITSKLRKLGSTEEV